MVVPRIIIMDRIHHRDHHTININNHHHHHHVHRIYHLHYVLHHQRMTEISLFHFQKCDSQNIYQSLDLKSSLCCASVNIRISNNKNVSLTQQQQQQQRNRNRNLCQFIITSTQPLIKTIKVKKMTNLINEIINNLM